MGCLNKLLLKSVGTLYKVPFSSRSLNKPTPAYSASKIQAEPECPKHLSVPFSIEISDLRISPTMTVQILRKKFTVGQYHQMIESGILTDRDHVELIQGEIIEMSPVGRRHAACVDRLNELFVLKFFQKALIRVQSPILLSDNSEPQPDVSILQRREDFYSDGHPTSVDIFALVEVSDSTIEFDRDVKVPMYAQEKIPEVWLVNLNNSQIERYRQPMANTYQQLKIFNPEETLNFQAFPDIPIQANQIFG